MPTELRLVREQPEKPLRVLFICTHNSARSQIAEALLTRKGKGSFDVASAGSQPAEHIHPLTVRALQEFGIAWSERVPKGFDAVADREWDLVILVCEQGRETCPAFHGNPMFAQWAIEDPAAAEGTEEKRLAAFRDAIAFLNRRIDLMLSLPIERLESRAAELRPPPEAHDRFPV